MQHVMAGKINNESVLEFENIGMSELSQKSDLLGSHQLILHRHSLHLLDCVNLSLAYEAFRCRSIDRAIGAFEGTP